MAQSIEHITEQRIYVWTAEFAGRETYIMYDKQTDIVGVWPVTAIRRWYLQRPTQLVLLDLRMLYIFQKTFLNLPSLATC